MGAEPPWSSGRESRGDRLEIGPLWRFLSPVSFPLKETGSRRSAKSPRPVLVPAAAVTSPPLALRETASGPPPLKGRQDMLPLQGSWREAPERSPRRSGQSSGLLRIRRLSLRFVSLSRRLRRASFFARADCQVKCNSCSEKTSYGVDQLRHLRGLRLIRAT